jgi:hypothetical protein
MANELLEHDNRRLRGQLQMAESRIRLAAEALEAFEEHLLVVARAFSVADIADLVRRIEAIQQLLAGVEGGGR